MPEVWAAELVELGAECGSLHVVVFEVGAGVWAGVLVEVVVQPGAG